MTRLGTRDACRKAETLCLVGNHEKGGRAGILRKVQRRILAMILLVQLLGVGGAKVRGNRAPPRGCLRGDPTEIPPPHTISCPTPSHTHSASGNLEISRGYKSQIFGKTGSYNIITSLTMPNSTRILKISVPSSRMLRSHQEDEMNSRRTMHSPPLERDPHGSRNFTGLLPGLGLRSLTAQPG